MDRLVIEDWTGAPWRKLEQHLYRLQKRIYQAQWGITANDHLTKEPDEAKVSRPVLKGADIVTDVRLPNRARTAVARVRC